MRLAGLQENMHDVLLVRSGPSLGKVLHENLHFDPLASGWSWISLMRGFSMCTWTQAVLICHKTINLGHEITHNVRKITLTSYRYYREFCVCNIAHLRNIYTSICTICVQTMCVLLRVWLWAVLSACLSYDIGNIMTAILTLSYSATFLNDIIYVQLAHSHPTVSCIQLVTN